jgi:uncharacterized protein
MTENSSGQTVRVRLRFYEELNDFLSRDRRKKEFGRILPETTTAKDLIEGCGVPHTEVDLVLVNGEPADFEQLDPKIRSILEFY